MKKITLILLSGFMAVSATAQLAWLQMPDYPGAGKFGLTAFSINDKGYMGLGEDSGGTNSTDWYEYDPIGNTWTAKASLPSDAKTNLVSFVINGKGYVTTGQTASGFSNSNETWEYDPVADSWTAKADFSGSARMNACGFSLNGKGYVGTGFVGGAVTGDFYEFDPVANSWTAKASLPGSTRNGAVAFTAGNKGYIGMGCAWNASSYYTDLYEYDPTADSWTQKADFPLPYIGNAVGYSSANAGFVLAGYYSQNQGISHNPMNMFYKYEPASDSWTLEGTFPGYPRGYAAGFSLSNDIYIGGGGRANVPANGPVYTDFWKLSNGLTLFVEPGGEQSYINIYPNPASGTITIDSPSGDKIETVRVYNMNGQLLLIQSTDKVGSELNVSALSQGIYFIEAVTKSGEIIDNKFVVGK